MVGLGMILDSQQGEDLAIQKVRTFEGTTLRGRANDDPPPYSRPPLPPRRPSDGPGASSASPILPSTSRPKIPSPQPSVGQLHILERNDPISGTFYIDPRVPSIGFDAQGDKARKKNPPHASFRTRNAPISLELGTTGDLDVAFPKANVLATARHGDITLKLCPMSSLHPVLGLEVATRGGNIFLFVPKDFTGAIQLSSHKGRIQFLPALASKMRVMKQSRKEALIMLGVPTPGETHEMSFCELKSRSGRLVVGFSDIDKYQPPPRFWQKVFS